MPRSDVYRVFLSVRARRETRGLDRQTLARISKAIDGLTEDPRPRGCLRVRTAERLWRIRVGDWRIGYEIEDHARIVTIITIGHRREFYE